LLRLGERSLDQPLISCPPETSNSTGGAGQSTLLATDDSAARASTSNAAAGGTPQVGANLADEYRPDGIARVSLGSLASLSFAISAPSATPVG
jgi:hypothetical protein